MKEPIVYKTGRTESESGKLSEELMERNTVERATRQKETEEQNKKEWESSVGSCQT